MSRGKKGKNNNGGNRKKKAAVKTVVIRAPTPRKGGQKKKQNRGKKNSTARVSAMPSAVSVQGSAMYSQQSMTLSGCDYLATIQVPSGGVNDSVVLQNYLLNPQRMVPGSRLAQFGALWDKFKFEYLEVIYEPSVATTTSGSIMLSADPDVLDTYQNIKGNMLLQKLSSTAHNTSVPVYGLSRLTIKDKRFFRSELFTEPETGSDPRNSYAGRVWLASVGGLAAGTYGRLYLKWKVKFTCPNIDEEFEEGTSLIAAFSGTYITSTYPWGDFSNIITNFPTVNAYLPADFVTFSSDAILGSVITFEAPGYYLVSMKRTGVAMGIGAFTTEVVLNQCTYSLPTNDTGFGSGVDFALANSASTASMWTVLIYAEASGAYISCTGDSGVTHTYGFVSVSRFDVTKGASGNLGVVDLPMSKSEFHTSLESMRRDFERKLQLALGPRPQLGLPVFETSQSTSLVEDENQTHAPPLIFNGASDSVTDQILALETVPIPAGFVLIKDPNSSGSHLQRMK